MTEIVLVTKDAQAFERLGAQLTKYPQNNIHRVASGKDVMALIRNARIDVVVADHELEDGLGLLLIKQIAVRAPFVNSALVSSLAAEDFHEETEGLGVFMQLPEYPKEEDGEQMMQLLESISVLLTL